jgi:hypothetical protein
MRNWSWAGKVAGCLGGALAVGVVAAVVAGWVGLRYAEQECNGQDECWTGLAAMVYGVLGGLAVLVLTVIVLGIVARAGIVFPLTTVAAAAILTASIWLGHGSVFALAPIFCFLAGIGLGGVLPSPWGGVVDQ